MPFNVNEFASAGLPLGGARPSLFSVIVDTPNGVPNVGSRVSFTCHATQIPSSELGLVEPRYFGRPIKLAGSRTFPNWDVQIYIDEDFAVRHAIETWSNSINKHATNLRSANIPSNADYRTSATVTQYAKTGTPIRTYRFVNIWPQTVGAIDLNWDMGDAIETFPVSFAYDWWDIVAPSTTGVLAV